MSVFNCTCPFTLFCFMKTRLATTENAAFSSVRAMRCLLFGHLLTVPYFLNLILLIIFVQTLFGNSIINCWALHPFCSYILLINTVFLAEPSHCLRKEWRTINCIISVAAFWGQIKWVKVNAQGHHFSKCTDCICKFCEHSTIFDKTTAVQSWRVLSETLYKQQSSVTKK